MRKKKIVEEGKQKRASFNHFDDYWSVSSKN